MEGSVGMNTFKNARDSKWDMGEYAKYQSHVGSNVRVKASDFCKPLQVDIPRYNFGGANEISLAEVGEDEWTMKDMPAGTMRKLTP